MPYKQQSMRLARIFRRTAPFQLPARAGIPPTWDRPDPPETQKSPRVRRQTNEEKHYTFFDAASPTFMLVNSEVAEGDVGDVLPAFAKNFSVLILAGALIGLAGYIWDSRSKLWVPTNYLYEVDKHRSQKTASQEKYGLKDLQSNPWKLNVWPESFPIRNLGIQDKSRTFEYRGESIQTIRKINKQAQAYWTRLYAESQKHVLSGSGSGHH